MNRSLKSKMNHKPKHHMKNAIHLYTIITLLDLGVCCVADAADDNTAADEKAQEADLVKKTLNPVASLISVPIQNNWDFNIGPSDAMRYTANVQPVIPFTLNQDWNLISRT